MGGRLHSWFQAVSALAAAFVLAGAAIVLRPGPLPLAAAIAAVCALLVATLALLLRPFTRSGRGFGAGVLAYLLLGFVAFAWTGIGAFAPGDPSLVPLWGHAAVEAAGAAGGLWVPQ